MSVSGLAQVRHDPINGSYVGHMFVAPEIQLHCGSDSCNATMFFRRTAKTCTAPGSLDTHLCYAAWRSSYSSRASIGV